MTDQVFIILRGVPWTLAITALAFAIGLVVGVPLMLMRISQVFPVRMLAVLILGLVRAIPPIVWVFIMFFGLGSGVVNLSPFVAAVVGLGLIAGANMAEIYRGGLISIHGGQWEAARALNMSGAWTWRDIILPQMWRVALPACATYAIGLLKDSAIASTIGVTDLAFQGARLSQETFGGLQIFAIVGAVYILLSLPVAWLSRRADLLLRRKVAR